MTDKQDPITHAARLLREAAEELRQAHAYSNSEGWENETDAKTAYDEHMAAAQALEDWEAAVGAGGVQALSAAPAVPVGWKLVPVEPTNDMQKAADEWAAKGFDWPKAVYRAMLAASPTPPAEQQAAPKAAPGDVLDEALRERDDAEDFIDALLDEVLGHERPEWSSSYGHADALNDVQERMTALHKPAVDKAWGRFQSAMAAPQQEAQEPAFWMNEKGHTWSHSDWKQFPKHRAKYPIPLYPHFPAPQPAPACHHRPPCAECASLTAQGGK